MIHFHLKHRVGFDRSAIIVGKLIEKAQSLEIEMIDYGMNIFMYGNNWMRIMRGRAAVIREEDAINEEQKAKKQNLKN